MSACRHPDAPPRPAVRIGRLRERATGCLMAALILGAALIPARADASSAALSGWGDDIFPLAFGVFLLAVAVPDLHFEWGDDGEVSTVAAWTLPITWADLDLDDVKLGFDSRLEVQRRSGVDARGLGAVRLPLYVGDDDILRFGAFAEGGFLFGGDGRAPMFGAGLVMGHPVMNLTVVYRQHALEPEVRRSVGIEFNLSIPLFMID